MGRLMSLLFSFFQSDFLAEPERVFHFFLPKILLNFFL